MTGSESELIFQDWKAVMCGRADAATRQRVAAAIEDPHTPMGAFLSKLHSDDPSFLARSLRAHSSTGADETEGKASSKVDLPPAKRRSLVQAILRGFATASLREWADWRVKKGDYDRAIWAWEMICSDLDNTVGTPRHLNSLAHVYWKAGMLEKAVEKMEAALSVASESRLTDMTCSILGDLVRLYLERQDIQRAHDRLEALHSLRGTGVFELPTDTNSRAIIAHYQGHHEDAIRLLREAENQSIDLHGVQNPLRGVILTNLATVYSALGESETAARTRMDGIQMLSTYLSSDERETILSSDRVMPVVLSLKGKQQTILSLPTAVAA